MKVILSRKGFDSGAGGCPSPIFPDGSMVALPIPGKGSKIRYKDLTWEGRNIGSLVSTLPRSKAKANHFAHLDPDLRPDAIRRSSDWRPIFGQRGSAQGHLRNQGVGPGDLFLFFGLFREVTEDGTFVARSPSRHIIWGWMQIADAVPVDRNRERLAWASYHPHLTCGLDPTNVVYIASENLDVPGADAGGAPGAGVFPRCAPHLMLTAIESESVITWRLPNWLHPHGRRSAMSYHGDPNRWTRDGKSVLLQVVGRGQEFVVDGGDYPEVVPWAVAMVRNGLRAGQG